MILNQISPMMYPRLKQIIEETLPVKVYGYVPVVKDCVLESRHLGLVMPEEIADLHDKLMKLAEQRISDRRILKLIRQWLVSGVLYGNVLTISELGTSQGSVISPLLANIYLNTLDRLWEKYGLTHGILVRYADDTVIICKNKKNANHALNLLQYIMAKLDLKLHPVKTKIVSMWDGKEGFDFLGMHHRRMTTETSKGQLYQETYQYPSRKASFKCGKIQCL